MFSIKIRRRSISIHAPHEGERQLFSIITSYSISDFNPRSPRGGATSGALPKPSKLLFQSTLPTRGSDDLDTKDFKTKLSISIHAPHEGERRFK